MSPVFSTVFLWLLAAILWWSGWREETSEGIPHWAVGIFLAGWPLAWLFNLPVSPTITLNGAWVWTLLAILLLGSRLSTARRWMSLSTGILIGCIYVLVSRISYYPSGISHYVAPWGAAILVGWLAAMLLRNVSEQVFAVSTGFYVSLAVSSYIQVTMDSLYVIKTTEWMENWWIAVLSAQLWTISVRVVSEYTRRVVNRMGGRRGGQSS